MGIDEKVIIAIHRIEDLYLKTGGCCYISFSGGKDSTVVLALIKMCSDLVIPENSIPAVFSDTGLELGATRDFVKWVKDNWYGNVQVIRPKKDFNWCLKNEGKPLKSKIKSDLLGRYKKNPIEGTVSWTYLALVQAPNGKQYGKTKLADKDMHMVHPSFDIKPSNKCCKILKKEPFKQYGKEFEGYITGIRMSEGGVRELNAKKREMENGKLCTTYKGKQIVKMPIIDWTDDDIEQFIEKYNVPLSKAYTEYGMKRTGCFLCPYSRKLKNDLEVLYKYEPNRYKAAMHWLEDVYIAQNIILPFDSLYEERRIEKWDDEYSAMRYEMLQKYRPKKANRFRPKDKQLKLDI